MKPQLILLAKFGYLPFAVFEAGAAELPDRYLVNSFCHTGNTTQTAGAVGTLLCPGYGIGRTIRHCQLLRH